MPKLAEELMAMADEQLAAQAPIAGLLESDPTFAAWAQRAVTPRIPLPLAVWGEGEPPAELSRVHEILDRHDLRLAAIIDEVGWPGRSLVGEDAADSAWLIAQHADRHQSLRATWLSPLEQAVAVSDADPRHLSRLTDRVAMIDGRPQLFGTYAHLDEDDNVEWDIPIEGSLADIDSRRAAIGLPPLTKDLREPPDAGPYRQLRKTPAFLWPPA